MIELMPYIGGLITLVFGIAFYYEMQEFREIEEEYKRDD